jgi:hypothetical protein
MLLADELCADCADRVTGSRHEVLDSIVRDGCHGGRTDRFVRGDSRDGPHGAETNASAAVRE